MDQDVKSAVMMLEMRGFEISEGNEVVMAVKGQKKITLKVSEVLD